jgi:uncharacterized membrane protein
LDTEWASCFARNRLWSHGRQTNGFGCVAIPEWQSDVIVPTLIPPVVAAIAAWLFASHAVPAVAYVSGTLGTLLGADVFNLGCIRDLNAPVASIGGAGTFDGIFVTGLLAALLA